jgi:hypothetical protein
VKQGKEYSIIPEAFSSYLIENQVIVKDNPQTWLKHRTGLQKPSSQI